MRYCGIHVKPAVKATESALDTNTSPPNYAGVNWQNTPDDPKVVANDLFGVSAPTEQMFSSMNYPGTFIPFYPQPAHYEFSMEGAPQSHYSSPPSSYPTQQYPHNNPIAGYAMPLPYQYMMWNQYAQFYNNALTMDTCSNKEGLNGSQKKPAPAKVKSSSDPYVEVFNGYTRRKRPLNQRDTRSSPDVTCLNSSLKTMKVERGFLTEEIPDENLSSYFADISSNDILSDSDKATNNGVKGNKINAAPLQCKENEGSNHFSGLNFQEKRSSDKIAGYKSVAETVKTTDADCVNKKVVSFDPKEEMDYVPCMDLHDIDPSNSSNERDPYYLPRLESLLKIGDETLLSIQTSMNLDINDNVGVRIGKDKEKMEIRKNSQPN